MSNAKISFDVRHAKYLQRWKEITVETFKDMIGIYTVGQKNPNPGTQCPAENALHKSSCVVYITSVGPE